MEVKIGVSARHVHLNEEHLKQLFGSNFELTKDRALNQFGQFASTSKVTLKTEKGELTNVRVLGPIRDYTQVEISLTDAYQLGIRPPVRTSGDLKGSAPVTIVGPIGSVSLEEGCIIANRHIHITKEERMERGLMEVSEVKVLVTGEKGGILDHVQIKEAPDSYFEMHLDTDDANAHLMKNGDMGEILIEKCL